MAENTSTDELKIIYSTLGEARHILHLYSPTIDKYKIHSSFFNGEPSIAYVTTEHPESVMKHFASCDSKLVIMPPEDIAKIKNYNKAIIDAGSIRPYPQKLENRKRKIGEEITKSDCYHHMNREEYLSKLSGERSILCTYNLMDLDPQQMKKLTATHDKLILTSGNKDILIPTTVSRSLEELSAEKVEQFVKSELETIVMALVMKQPMCGREISETIYRKFDVLLSSGTIYPLLHNLEQQGLLHARAGIKTKTYTPANVDKLLKILDEHKQANEFLNGFLETTVNGRKLLK